MTKEMIDAGARTLRQRFMSGRRLGPWEDVSNPAKAKWRNAAEEVFAAMCAADAGETPSDHATYG